MERQPHQGGEYHHDKHEFTPEERIDVGIIAAIKGDVVLDEHTARTIATQLGSDKTPMLDLFAQTGRIERSAMSELNRIRLHPDTPEQHARWIDWLGGYWRSQQQEQAKGMEGARAYAPRVFIADLASLESKLDHGVWVDANQPTADIKAAVAAMLHSSPVAYSDKWTVGAFHDFAGINMSGFTDPALISRLGRGVHEHGAAYSAWAFTVGADNPEQLDKFSDFYVGSYDSQEAWVRSIGADLQWQEQLDNNIDPRLRPYVLIDYAKFLHDIVHKWDVVRGHDGHIHVFLR